MRATSSSSKSVDSHRAKILQLGQGCERVGRDAFKKIGIEDQLLQDGHAVEGPRLKLRQFVVVVFDVKLKQSGELRKDSRRQLGQRVVV
eukprot:754420-Hanusia_phi.AAC.4